MKDKLLEVLGLNTNDFKVLKLEYDGVVVKRIRDNRVDKVRY